MKRTESAKASIVKDMLNIKNALTLNHITFKTNGIYPTNTNETDVFIKENIQDFLNYISVLANRIKNTTQNLPKAYKKQYFEINTACNNILHLTGLTNTRFYNVTANFPSNESEANIFIKKAIKLWLQWFTEELHEIELSIFDPKSKAIYQKFGKFASEMTADERKEVKEFFKSCDLHSFLKTLK